MRPWKGNKDTRKPAPCPPHELGDHPVYRSPRQPFTELWECEKCKGTFKTEPIVSQVEEFLRAQDA